MRYPDVKFKLRALFVEVLKNAMDCDEHLVIKPQAMGRVDRATIKAGIPGYTLMQRAGRAIARLAAAKRGRGSALVLCGPGNNGGDGFVAAQQLIELGWDVDLFCTRDLADLTGDARKAAQDYQGSSAHIRACRAGFEPYDMFIDAVFGAGLSRPLDDDIAGLLTRALAACEMSIAVDLPSGLDGATGADLSNGLYQKVAGFDHCVTFGAYKYGHVLEPARSVCGEIWLAEIGLDVDALRDHATARLNMPVAAADDPVLQPSASTHKYMRGHVGVMAGPARMAGASRLAARAALAVGAGLVTRIAMNPVEQQPAPDALMHARLMGPDGLEALVRQRKISTLVIGPGLGTEDNAVRLVDATLSLRMPVVFDADALTLIAQNNWLGRLSAASVLTPHMGEFSRLFGDQKGGRVDAMRRALDICAGAMVLKGADTLIGQGGQAARTHDGHLAINVNAPPWLATAGSGDVLAGIIAGLWGGAATTALQVAQRGVYIHGLAGQMAGQGAIADDLIRAISGACQYFVSAGHRHD